MIEYPFGQSCLYQCHLRFKHCGLGPPATLQTFSEQPVLNSNPVTIPVTVLIMHRIYIRQPTSTRSLRLDSPEMTGALENARPEVCHHVINWDVAFHDRNEVSPKS